MICTAGFRDVLEIARLTRPPDQIYDLRAALPLPLIRRRDRLEIAERIDHHGGIVTPIDESSVVEAAHVLARRGITSVAVCSLHSYVNNAHEKVVRDIFAREIPGVSISISSEFPSSVNTSARARPRSMRISPRSSAATCIVCSRQSPAGIVAPGCG
jgi:N-methylhydantoinase A/oxoprolinase/acetone carboxylase beta subunit